MINNKDFEPISKKIQLIKGLNEVLIEIFPEKHCEMTISVLEFKDKKFQMIQHQIIIIIIIMIK